jgi:hypothetical protein
MSYVRKKAINNGEYVDLYIVDNDIALDELGCPDFVDGRASIAQDIQHMIRETGVLFQLIGQRNRELRQVILVELVLLIEDDDRIIPGTTIIIEENIEKYWITAKTVDYHEIGFYI